MIVTVPANKIHVAFLMEDFMEQQPIYKQIADLLRDKIEKEEYQFGQFIPSERELSSRYGVNRLTVRKSIACLVEEGLLLPRPGKGTYVNRPKINSPLDTIQGTGPFLREMGLTPTNRLIYSGKRKAGWKYASIFNISQEDDIFQIFRVRLGDGEPFFLEYTYLPNDLIPNIEQYDFTVYSLYDLFNLQGIVLAGDTQTLEIVSVTSPQSTLLNVPDGEQVFMITDTSTNINGRIVEYTKSYSSGKKFTFSTTMEE